MAQSVKLSFSLESIHHGRGTKQPSQQNDLAKLHQPAPVIDLFTAGPSGRVEAMKMSNSMGSHPARLIQLLLLWNVQSSSNRGQS